MMLINKHVVSCILLIFTMIMSSCSIETYSTKKYDANQEILSYISNESIDVMPKASGLVFIPTDNGNGDNPKLGDKVAFHYKGYYMNGEVFDSSYDKAYPLIVHLGNNSVIKGLEEALLMMNKGAKAKVIIPFYLAYNDREYAPVPPYSNLIFELELIDFIHIAE